MLGRFHSTKDQRRAGSPPSPAADAPSPEIRRRASVALWLSNVALGTAVGTAYLVHVPEDQGPEGWAFALLALVSSVLTLTVPVGLLSVAAAHWIRPERVSPRVVGAVQAFTWTAFQVLLFADTRIYNLFRYHFNGHVWNLLFTRGSQDSVRLGWQVWTAIAAGLLVGTTAQYLLWSFLRRRAESAPGGKRFPAALLRPSAAVAVLLLAVVCLEKTIYAQADLARDRRVTKLSQLFPLYPRIPADELARSMLGNESTDPPSLEVDGKKLHYPLEEPALDPAGPRPNVLIIVLDCWRQDMLRPDVTPNISGFAEDARVFEDHVSGGNSTRFGLLSMLYGLHGSYWFPILNERRSPVLLDVLLAEGYDLRAFSSASMTYPEMRSTAWVRIPDAVVDEPPGETPWERDEALAEIFGDWLDRRSEEGREDPFFGFLLLDSPHQTYSYPPRLAQFEPAAEEWSYFDVSGAEGPDPTLLERIVNRYRNAVFHADEVTGRILDGLRSRGLLDDTLVVITGDHGEEFLEHGFFGHTSNFTRTQLGVPFVLRGPGVRPGVETRPTSHLDVPSTLLELLGADPAVRPRWCLGGNLLDPLDDRRRVASGWKELGLWVPGGILRIPLHDHWSFDVELFDESWKPILDDGEVLDAEQESLAQLAEECRRFLR